MNLLDPDIVGMVGNAVGKNVLGNDAYRTDVYFGMDSGIVTNANRLVNVLNRVATRYGIFVITDVNLDTRVDNDRTIVDGGVVSVCRGTRLLRNSTKVGSDHVLISVMRITVGILTPWGKQRVVISTSNGVYSIGGTIIYCPRRGRADVTVTEITLVGRGRRVFRLLRIFLTTGVRNSSDPAISLLMVVVTNSGMIAVVSVGNPVNIYLYFLVDGEIVFRGEIANGVRADLGVTGLGEAKLFSISVRNTVSRVFILFIF